MLLNFTFETVGTLLGKSNIENIIKEDIKL